VSTKLGTLTLDLVARIGSFVGPVRDAERQTEVSFGKMRESVSAYGAVAVAGAAAAGTAIFAMAKEFAAAANELENYAFISKATTQEFQSYSVGAQTVGIEVEALASQFKDFNEKLGEFITLGSGGGVDFFEQIAIKTEGSAEGARKLALEMQKLSGPQALQLYVDKLEEAGVTQQQMSFYLESMASDTTNLIPLLKNGGEGFKFWADAAERYGLIMDESAIQKAAEFKVQLSLLDMQVQGAKNQFIQGLMPALVSVGDAMSDAKTDTNLMADAGATLGNIFRGVAATGLGVYATIKMLSNAIAGLAVDATNAKKHMNTETGWKKYSGWNVAKSIILGTAIARTSEDSGIGMAAKDNAKVVEDIGSQISKIFSDTADSAAQAMAKIQSGQAGVISGSDEWIKKQNEAAKASSGLNQALQEQARLLEQQKRDREQISKTYASDYQNLLWGKEDQEKLIAGAGFTQDEHAKYLKLAQMRFDAESAEYFKTLNLEFNQYKWTEEEKLEYAHRINREIAENDVKLADEVREAKLKFLDEQYAIELRKAQWHALEVQQTMRDAISGLSGGADDIFAKATMTPQEYSQWSLESDRSNAQVGLKKERVKVEQDIMTSDAYSTDDERYEALKLAHQEYRDGLYAIDLQYDQQVKDLAQQQKLDQMNLWSGVLGQAQNTFAQLAQSAKDASGEQSSTYRTMFAMQQAFSVASSLTAAWTAYAQAFADPSAMTLPQKIAGGATVLAALMPAVTTISSIGIDGMAHDGIDNIPREGTWLLDGGERVLNPNQNKDLTKYLNDARGNSQSSQNKPIENNLRVIIVRDENEAKDMLYGPDGEKAFLYHQRRNRSRA